MLQITPIDPFMLRSGPGITGRVYTSRHARYIPLIGYTALAPLAVLHMFLSIHTCRLYSVRAAVRAARVRICAPVNIRILAAFIHAAFILPFYYIYMYACRLPAISPARRLATRPAASYQRALYHPTRAPAHTRDPNLTHESRPLSSADRPDSIPIPRARKKLIGRANPPPFYNPYPFVKFYTSICILQS